MIQTFNIKQQEMTLHEKVFYLQNAERNSI